MNINYKLSNSTLHDEKSKAQKKTNKQKQNLKKKNPEITPSPPPPKKKIHHMTISHYMTQERLIMIKTYYIIIKELHTMTRAHQITMNHAE